MAVSAGTTGFLYSFEKHSVYGENTVQVVITPSAPSLKAFPIISVKRFMDSGDMPPSFPVQKSIKNYRDIPNICRSEITFSLTNIPRNHLYSSFEEIRLSEASGFKNYSKFWIFHRYHNRDTRSHRPAYVECLISQCLCHCP